MGLKKAWKKYSRPVLGVLTSGISEGYYQKRDRDNAKKADKKWKKSLFGGFNDATGMVRRSRDAGEGIVDFDSQS